MPIILDFETRSRVDITKTGAWRYSQDPSTDVLCMAYAIDDGPVQLWVPSQYDLPADYEETRTADLLHKIKLAENRVIKYTKEEREDLKEKAEGEIVFYKSLLNEDNEFKLDFTYHTEIPKFITDEDIFKEIGGILEAHNASFEQAIWNNVLVPKYGAFKTPPIVWRDSMAMCAAHNIPLSLEKAGAALELDQQKDVEGKRVMLQLSQTRRPSASNPSEWWTPETAPDKFETLFKYCMDDVATERAIGLALEPLIKKEQWVWLLDQMINQRGVQVDTDLIHRCLELIKEHTEWGKSEITRITDGAVTSVTLVAQLLEWVQSQGVDATDMTKASVEGLIAEESTPEHVKEALRIRQSLSKSSTKKLQTMLDAKAIEDDRIRNILLYHGASTGRWAGRLIQVQNFPRGNLKYDLQGNEFDMDQAIEDIQNKDLTELAEKYGDIMELISSCLRGMLVPAKENDFIVADYGAIEARIVMWYADEQDALQKFREGVDLYKDMAGFVYDKEIDDISAEERHLGKGIILGCLGEETPVLTNNGVKPITKVRDIDLLWDGEEWVSHQGSKYQGRKYVIRLAGVLATPDHKVLVNDEWVSWGELADSPSLLKESLRVDLDISDLSEEFPDMPKTRLQQIRLETIIKSQLNKKSLLGNKLEFHRVQSTSIGERSVYDIMNAGPRNRFTIITNRGAVVVHNCGFGMGAPKFKATVSATGEEISEQLAAKSVKAYREKYSGVPEFWRNTEEAAIKAVRTKEPQSTNKTTWTHNLETNFLECLLPSGRSLYYYDPKIRLQWAVKWIDNDDRFHFDKYNSKDEAERSLEGLQDNPNKKTIIGDVHECESLTHMGVNSVTKQWQRQETYGGKLVENIVQGTARDCMIEGMFRTERKKYLTIMTIHDEIVSEIPEGEGSVEEFEALLAQTPDWAEGLPLVAEGWRGKRYRK